MTKEILESYQDICSEIKELQETVAVDTVTGSYEDYPYTKHSITIHGACLSDNDMSRLDRLKQDKRDILTFVDQLPLRQKRIVTYRVIKGLRWSQVAARMGYNYTIEGVKKIYKRIFK